MRKERSNDSREVKEWRLVISLFAIYWGVLLLMSGLHSGLVVLMEERQWNVFIKSVTPILYWGIVAAGLTLFTRQEIKKTYEEPLHKMAEAARKVSEGDFSVYVPTIHTADKLDYLDVMIMDFNKMVEELGSIETLKTDFISNVSHELKTPLAIIQNYATMLQQSNRPEEQRQEYAKAVADASRRLSSLITNILKLNKLENQQIYPEREIYNLGEQLCQCLLAFEDVWEEKNIELDTDLEDDVLIQSDAELMTLVWNNLISNALKFTAPGGCVTVSLEAKENFAVVQINDPGCGIPPDVGKHIFEKFYQGDTSHATQGNGLGLALVKRVVDIVNGDISVASEVGEGSTFTVRIRRAQNESD